MGVGFDCPKVTRGRLPIAARETKSKKESVLGLQTASKDIGFPAHDPSMPSSFHF